MSILGMTLHKLRKSDRDVEFRPDGWPRESQAIKIWTKKYSHEGQVHAYSFSPSLSRSPYRGFNLKSAFATIS